MSHLEKLHKRFVELGLAWFCPWRSQKNAEYAVPAY
jgi:hypothetical protein